MVIRDRGQGSCRGHGDVFMVQKSYNLTVSTEPVLDRHPLSVVSQMYAVKASRDLV